MYRSYSDHLQGARSFLVKITEFKITKNIKGSLWHCGSTCGVHVWRSVWRCKSKRMLPHCHNEPFIFLVILNSVTLTRKLRAP
jgi:hypothetical protein